jgi:hypothetical protein
MYGWAFFIPPPNKVNTFKISANQKQCPEDKTTIERIREHIGERLIG